MGISILRFALLWLAEIFELRKGLIIRVLHTENLKDIKCIAQNAALFACL